ncbi:MAG: riboflavin synthase [Actinomycetota bacterium]
MFTGIIEELGGVKALTKSRGKCTLEVFAPKVTEDLKIGDSIAVSGVCLTVTERGGNRFRVDISPETLEKTNLGELKSGDAVNLERALRFCDRLGGHMVTGHVDGMGAILNKIRKGDAIILKIETPSQISRYLIPQGSIAVDGVSLTIVGISTSAFMVSIIPHTARVTTLGFKGPGLKVNLEADIFGKYIESFLRKSIKDNLTLETLLKHGFISGR